SELFDGRIPAADFAVCAARGEEFSVWVCTAGEFDDRAADRGVVDSQRGLPVHAWAALVSAGRYQFDRSTVADAEFGECGRGGAWVHEPRNGCRAVRVEESDCNDLRSWCCCAERTREIVRVSGAAGGVEWAICRHAGIFQLFPAVGAESVVREPGAGRI